MREPALLRHLHQNIAYNPFAIFQDATQMIRSPETLRIDLEDIIVPQRVHQRTIRSLRLLSAPP